VLLSAALASTFTLSLTRAVARSAIVGRPRAVRSEWEQLPPSDAAMNRGRGKGGAMTVRLIELE
jgi:hypothetical protein